MGWIGYAVVVLILSGIIGRHLGRFHEAYTEMTGMMAGMTMGMLNGFVLGYCAAAATNSMFWGNLFGILLGLTLGLYFGRGGGLMGIMDGAMGGVMGGSMGAMLAVMVRFPDEAFLATGVLLGAIYVAGMIGLVVLIEQQAPAHAHLHRLAPLFARVAPTAPGDPLLQREPDAPGLVNYYEMLDLPVQATTREIALAYRTYIVDADEPARALADVALATLCDSGTRARYDRELAVAAGRGECCPPPRRTPVPAGRPTTTQPAPGSRRSQETTARGR
ncbi:MAG TPA: hypothetical protein VKY74_13145 [Chloroflexia bacterium]|nr:hypothetical protein [Chloroflexia bacterium]